jgi:hypothetical protein
MKRLLFLTSVSFFVLAARAQKEAYREAMVNNIMLTDTTRSSTDLERAAAVFLAIYEAKKDWLAQYYHVYSLVKAASLTKILPAKESLLSKAALVVDSMKDGLRDEILVLQALYSQIYLSFHRDEWRSYLPRIDSFLDSAIHLNSGNPRAYYLQALIKYNMPEPLGGGKNVALPLIEKSCVLFSSHNGSQLSGPTWGKAEAENLLAAINSEK